MKKRSTFSRWTSATILMIVLLGGCAGSRGAADDAPEDEPVDEPRPVIHATYERFDPAPYREEEVEPTALIHDVPDRLMRGRVETGGTRVMEGFRIQLFQTQDPSQAEQFVDQATEWWYRQREAGATGSLFSPSSAPIYNVWRQPYYRIRLGDFATRDAADTALQAIQSRFTGAFVVPDRVTITN